MKNIAPEAAFIAGREMGVRLARSGKSARLDLLKSHRASLGQYGIGVWARSPANIGPNVAGATYACARRLAEAVLASSAKESGNNDNGGT